MFSLSLLPEACRISYLGVSRASGLRHTGAGVLTMANHGPNTNTSQFLVLLGPAPTLDGKNTIFGRVCGGIHTLKKLSLVQTTKTDRPLHDVKIIRASVAESTD